MPTQEDKLIICGTGRAGTTLLMRIFTIAGLDTGFSERRVRGTEGKLGRAGLEKAISKKTKADLPQVIKSPHFVGSLPKILEEDWFKIAMAIVPVRELGAAAQSRITVHEDALGAGVDPKKTPGGLWKTEDPADQSWVLAEQFYRTVERLVAYDIPLNLVSFPRFALDID